MDLKDFQIKFVFLNEEIGIGSKQKKKENMGNLVLIYSLQKNCSTDSFSNT